MKLEKVVREVLYLTAAIVVVELALSWVRKPAAGGLGGHILGAKVASGCLPCAVPQTGCSAGPECSTPASLKPGEDPWEQMKWINRPAKQRIRGLLIEELDPDNNFRRGFSLSHCLDDEECVEDKMHLLPWLLASRVDLNCAPRRVLLDLGARYFNTSVQWFMTYYPADFTEVHAFERVPGLFTVPEGIEENVVLQNLTKRRRVTPPEVPQWQRSRVHAYEKYVSISDTEATIDITRFIKEELKIRPEDALIVKMDVEGEEWKILPVWAEVLEGKVQLQQVQQGQQLQQVQPEQQDAEMVMLVDEIFVEVHYHHPSMGEFGWNEDNFKWTRDEAVELYQGLRDKGFFVHAWP